MIYNYLFINKNAEDGKAIVEYVLIIAFVLLVISIAVKAVGLEIMRMYLKHIWENIKDALS